MEEPKLEDDQIILSKQFIQEHIINAIPKVVGEMFERSYSNPLKDALEAEIKENDGLIRVLVKELLVEVLADAKSKDSLKDAIVQKIIEKSFLK